MRNQAKQTNQNNFTLIYFQKKTHKIATQNKYNSYYKAH